MHKLFDYISTPLKRFLACLAFHMEEIRVRHLHKRTNTGSARTCDSANGNFLNTLKHAVSSYNNFLKSKMFCS